jgi:hypothetical protein
MKQYAQQVRSKLLTLIMTAVVGFGLATAATAAGVRANANVDAGAEAGGSTDAHMSTSGSTNSNAQWQSEASQGADRAAARTSPYGAEMKQSGEASLDAGRNAAARRKP